MGVTESKIFGCPSRKSSAKDGAAAAKVTAGKQIKDPALKPRAVTKHTTRQFEASTLSRDAEEFQPQQRRSPTIGKAPPRVDPNEPEWAQFLAKKAVEQHAKSEPLPQLKGSRNGGGADGESKAPPMQPAAISVNTSEYLKLLKAGEQKQSSEKQRRDHPWNALKPSNDVMGAPPGLGGESPMASLKNDLTGALDSIIRSQRQQVDLKKKKPTALKKVIMQERAERSDGSKGNALWRIAQMLESGQGGLKPEDEEEEVPTIAARDDLQVERQNRDEDLAELAYWSEDDQAPKAIHRASAHKVGARPLDNREIREYVTQEVSRDLDRQVAILMLHLRRLNDRHRTFDPEAPGKRRFVVGIKEVFRAVRHGKVKCILVAPDIEEISTAGGLDERVRDILRVSYQQDVPVIFALSRVRIGRSLGKSLRMSVVAILEVTGVQALYDSTIALAYSKRLEWISKQPKLQYHSAGADEVTQARPAAKSGGSAQINGAQRKAGANRDGNRNNGSSRSHWRQ